MDIPVFLMGLRLHQPHCFLMPRGIVQDKADTFPFLDRIGFDEITQ